MNTLDELLEVVPGLRKRRSHQIAGETESKMSKPNGRLCSHCGEALSGYRRVYCSDECRYACIAERRRTRRERRNHSADEGSGIFTAYIPTEEEIASAAAEVRATWSPSVEMGRRAVGPSPPIEVVDLSLSAHHRSLERSSSASRA